MSEKQLDLQLNKHLEEVISSRKVSLEDTRQIALSLWDLICNHQHEHKSKRVIIQHYSDGKIITTMYTDKQASTPQGNQLTTFIDEKLVEHWPDFELLPMLSIIAENSNVKGKCRLCENSICKEIHLDFK